MRLSTVFVSSALMLAGMITTTLAVERENMLVARFADSDFLAPVEARAYDEELELHARGFARRSYYVSDDDELVARGDVISNDDSRGGDKERKFGRPPKDKIAKDDPSPQYYGPTHLRDKNLSAETGSSRNHTRPNGRFGYRRRRRPSATGANAPNRASGNKTAHGNDASNATAVHSASLRPPPHRLIR